MDRSAAARLGLAAGLLLAPLLLPAAQATHAPLSLPLREDHPRVRSALDWFGARADGCVHHPDFPPDPGRCGVRGMKWVAVAVAGVGADPAAWPRPNASVAGWLLDHADSLREEGDDCRPDSGTDPCRQKAVFSRAKSLLAFAAAGVDPRAVPLPDSGQRDLVDELLDWHRGGQFGGSGYVSDDIFALLALEAAGYEDERTRSSADLVASTQGPDGGVGWEVQGSPSPEMTGASIQALAPRDRPGFVDDALGYLEDTQNRTGPHRACWDEGSPDAGNTAWALLGLVAAGEDPRDWSVGGRTPIRCLASLQAPDGGFRSSPGSGPSYIATHEALTALAWTPYGTLDGPAETVTRDRTARVGDAVTLAPGSDTTLRDGNRTRQAMELEPAEPGTRAYHGLAWNGTPTRLDLRLRVQPPVPAAPAIEAPGTHPASEPVPVNVTPADRWTASVTLVLPDGSTLGGTTHRLDLEAGVHRLAARAANALGEAGPAAHHDVVVRNPGPTVAVEGPSTAAPAAEAHLHAEARDPDGETVHLRWETPNGTLLATGPNLTIEPRPGGKRTVVAVVADPHGRTTREDHTVRWRRPTVEVQGPHRAPEGVLRLRANVTPGTAAVTWLVDGEPAADGAEVRLDLAPGDHRVRAVATVGNATAEALHPVQVPADDAVEPTGADAPTGDGDPGPRPDPDGAPSPGPREATPAADADARGTPAAGPLALAAAGLAALRRRRDR